MLLDHLLEHAPLQNDLARLEKVLDVHLVVVQSSSLPGNLLHGLEKSLAAVARDKERTAACTPETEVAQNARHIPLQVFLLETVLEILASDKLKVGRQGEIHAVLTYNQITLSVAVAQSSAPGLVVDLPVEAGTKVTRLRAKSLSTTAEQGGLLGAHTGATGSLLRTHLAVRAVNFVTGFRRGGSLARVVTFVDDGEVEDVATEREVQMVHRPLLEGGWFEGGEGVNGERNGRD